MDSQAVMAVALFGSIASLAWSAAFAWARWLARARDPEQSASLNAGLEQRLGHLELAVDTIAVELERLAETQRYVTRILEERLPAPRPALPSSERPAPRTITPH